MSRSLVQLYCYDLSAGMAANMSQMLLGRQIDGIWHTAIIVYGKEFYFDGGVGIVHSVPGQSRFGQPIRVESLGTTVKTDAEFNTWVQEKRRGGFGPDDYSLLHRNCNHFTQEAAQFLLGVDIPRDIRDQIPVLLETALGRMLRPMLEGMTTAAPVGGNSTAAPLVPAYTPTTTSTSTTTTTGLHSKKERFSEEEEDDLMIALVMLQSNELLSGGSQEGLKMTCDAIALLRTSLVNILENPTQSKYRGLLTTSESYMKKLSPFEEFGLSDILRLSGFRKHSHPSGKGQQWFLADEDGSEEILSIMIAHLNELIETINKEAQPSDSTAVDEKERTSEERQSGVQETSSTAKAEGDAFLEIILNNAGIPLSSYEMLEMWSANEKVPITPGVPCRQRVPGAKEAYPRLLVCHDMRGGYTPGDFARYALCDPSSSSSSPLYPVVDTSYTVDYWHLVDYFVYFSHNRFTIPPKEWINAAHRQGVSVLGVFINEGEDLDIRMILHDAKKMALTIHKMVELCNVYNFDGYLINIESSVGETLAKRLVAFVSMLRQTLNKNCPPSSVERTVIWYDAVNIDGCVKYANALSEENKPFFDVANGIFTNYGWSLSQLTQSQVLAGDRNREVYVGVDVFGRSKMFGGGGYNSKKAVEAADSTKLSVALFAPGWVLENEGENKRETFLRANAKMWSGMQAFFNPKRVKYDTLPLWTCFRSGVGKQMYVNGERLVGGASPATEWCQLSQTHMTPCFQFASDPSEGNALYVLPVERGDSGLGKTPPNVVPVEWNTDAVWIGDRSLEFVVPAGCAVAFLKEHIDLDEGTANNNNDNGGALAFLDAVWWRSTKSAGVGFRRVRRMRLEGKCRDSTTTTQIVLNETENIIASVGNWEIVRYVIPASTNWSCVTSVAVLNLSSEDLLPCRMGGISFAPPWNDKDRNINKNGDSKSVLLVGSAHELPAEDVKVMLTKEPTVRVIEVRMTGVKENINDFLLFAKVRVGDGTPFYMYMGQQKVIKGNMLLEIRLPPTAVVTGLEIRGVSPGS